MAESILAKFIGGGDSLFAVDIGLGSVKVCELSRVKDSFKLERFTSVPLSESALIDDEVHKPEEIVDAIKQAVSASKAKSKSCIFALGGQNTMTKRLQVDGERKVELEENVLWELDQYKTFGGEAKVDYHVVSSEDGSNDVVVCAVREDILTTFRSLIEEAGLKVKVIDLQVFALANIFEHIYRKDIDKYSEGTALFDFGAQSTKIVIYKRGTAHFTKELAFGGVLITEEIQRQMGVGYEEAEDLKTSGVNGKLPEDVVKIIEQIIEQWFGDIKKTLNFYISATSQEKIQYAFVTGGASLTPGLITGLKEVLGVEVELMRPFDSIAYDSRKFKKEELALISSIGTVPMGVAMRRFG